MSCNAVSSTAAPFSRFTIWPNPNVKLEMRIARVVELSRSICKR